MQDSTINYYGLQIPVENQVFLHIFTEEFTSRAYDTANIEMSFEDFCKSHAVVYYAAQLAIAAHRPNHVREIEENALKEYLDIRKSRKEKEIIDIYGDDLPECVQFAGTEWSTSMFIGLVQSIDETRHAPRLSSEEIELMPHATRSRYYIDAKTDKLTIYLSKQAKEWIKELTGGHNPYSYLKGYEIDQDLEILQKQRNNPSKAQSIQNNIQKKYTTPFDRDELGEFLELDRRYEARFSPDYFIWIARQDIERRIGVFTDQQVKIIDHIARKVVGSILEKFAPETRSRHNNLTDANTQKTIESQPHSLPPEEVAPVVNDSDSPISWSSSVLDPDMLLYLDVEMAKRIIADSREGK